MTDENQDLLTKYREQVDDFLTNTEVGRAKSELSRDMVNGHQWSEEESAEILNRSQAPIVVNRLKPKVAGMKGLLIQQRTDPKAFPRTQKHEEAAEAITDGLRYVMQNTDFDAVKQDVSDEFFVEGYSGVLVGIQETKDDIEITIKHIPWDRIYYDPHSRRKDFADARYMGVIVWMYFDVAQDKYGELIDDSDIESSATETLDDRPRWLDGSGKRRRVRVAKHFAKEGEKWVTCTFNGTQMLEDVEDSPFLDENGIPDNPLELISAYVDREDNRRFGEVEHWLDLQREINKRRSKALHLLSQRQTKGRKGSIKDVPAMKRELAKPDGHVEFEGDDGDFDVLPTGDMANAQFALLEEAKAEIDSVGFNAQLSGERQGNLSGKAINSLQSAGVNELADLFSFLNGWEKRVYRKVWDRIVQFWTAEKWIRVTDDQENLRWVGFNVAITVAKRLEEIAQDESIPEDQRLQSAQTLQAMAQAQDPRLNEVIEIQNALPEIDVDIILDQSLDSVNVQAQQFELLATMAANRPEVSFADLLRLSTLRDKDTMIKNIEEREAANQQAVAQAAETNAIAMQTETQIKLDAELQKIQAEQQGKMLINQQTIEGEKEMLAAKLLFEQGSGEVQQNLQTSRADLAREVGQTIAVPAADNLASAIEQLATASQNTEQTEALIKELQRPLTIERDAEGKAVGIA